MVSTLAGSLALVTCKEPLRVQLTNTLKAQLQPPPNLSADVMESIIRCVLCGGGGRTMPRGTGGGRRGRLYSLFRDAKVMRALIPRQP